MTRDLTGSSMCSCGIHCRAPISVCPVLARTYDRWTVLIPFATRPRASHVLPFHSGSGLALCRARGYAAGGVVGPGLPRARLRRGGIISGLAVVIFVPGVWSRCPIDQTGECRRHRSGVTAQALAPVMGYLRSVQAIPAEGQPVPATPLEALLAVYRQYLEGERGLLASTIRHYLRYARMFLSGFPGPLPQTFQELSAGQVTGYVLEQARSRRQGQGGTGHGAAARAAVPVALPARGRAYPASAG